MDFSQALLDLSQFVLIQDALLMQHRRMSERTGGIDSLVRLRDGHPAVERCANALCRALEDKDSSAARAHFSELHDLIDQHMRSEEEIAFPIAIRRDPSQAASVKSLRLAHISMREDLTRVGELVERGHFQAAHTGLDAFMELMEAHERLEDQLIAELEGRGSA